MRIRAKKHTSPTLSSLSGVVALSALLLVTGCDNRDTGADDKTQAPAVLQSQQETLERQAPGCGENEDCASVSIAYELFENQPGLNDAIREQLIEQLQGFSDGDSAADSIAAAADNFLKGAAELPEGASSARWQLQGDSKLLAQHGNLATIEISSYAYTGGAHGIQATHWLNWDLETNKPVALEQIIKPGRETVFWDLARTAHERWLSEQSNIDDDFHQIWPFQKTSDFRFDDKGLILLYGVYTLGPYAMGETQLALPREQLRGVVLDKYLPK